jgi:hypothetical protein
MALCTSCTLLLSYFLLELSIACDSSIIEMLFCKGGDSTLSASIHGDSDQERAWLCSGAIGPGAVLVGEGRNEPKTDRQGII